MRAEHRRRGRLPDHRAAHQSRRGGQVPADRGEVERRYRVDETFESPVLELVPHRVVGDWLLAVQLLGEVRVEPPEVDQLARRVDLRLEYRLRLPEHRRGIERGAPGGGEQLGRLEEDRGALLPRPASPFALRLDGLLDGQIHLGRARRVVVGQHVVVPVRHRRGRSLARADLTPSDDEGDVDPLARHLLEARLDLGALGTARRVASDRLVDRGWDPASPVECHQLILVRITLSETTAPGTRGAPGRRPPGCRW